MLIDNNILKDSLNLSFKESIKFDALDYVNSGKVNTLTFMDDEYYIPELLANPNIGGLFVTEEIMKKLDSKDFFKIICDDPRYYFYKLFNYCAELKYKKVPTEISKSAIIHKDAKISEYNVIIGDNVIVEENAVVHPDVYIGKNSRLCAGSICGAEGFELKRTKKEILSVIHDGKLVIGEDVFVGFNTVINKGFSFRDTIIGNSTKIDSLVYIAHSVHLGSGCFIVGKAMICGSSTLGDNIWIGPGAMISNQITIGDNADISLGAVVTQNVASNEKVSGNFAIDHKKFIEFIKKIR